MKILLCLTLLTLGLALATPTEEDCDDALFHVDPENCPEVYYRCYENGHGGWDIEQHTCPPGTVFHPEIQQCDWPGDWTDEVCDGTTPQHPTQPTTTITTTSATDNPATSTTTSATDNPR